MTNRDLRIQWAIEAIEKLAGSSLGQSLGIDTYNLWKAKRDETVRDERAAKNAERVQEALGRAHDAYNAKKALPLTYVVHGYDRDPRVNQNVFPPLPVQCALIYAGPDEDHAREIAVAYSMKQHSVSHRPDKRYEYTSISVCEGGKPVRLTKY